MALISVNLFLLFEILSEIPVMVTDQFKSPDYLQAETPNLRQSHSLVNSIKPGALVSPLLIQIGDKKVRQTVTELIYTS